MNNISSINNTKAMISMISGIAGWVLYLVVFCFNATIGLLITLATLGVGLICLQALLCIPPIGWIIAIIIGHLGLSEIKTSGEGGRGMAIAGLVMGYSGFGFIFLSVIVGAVIILLGGSIPIFSELLGELNP